MLNNLSFRTGGTKVRNLFVHGDFSFCVVEMTKYLKDGTKNLHHKIPEYFRKKGND